LLEKRTNVIGLYAGPWNQFHSSLFGSNLMDGFQEGIDEAQVDLLLYGTLGLRSPESIYNSLANGKVDGLILYTRADDPVLPKLKMSHLPLVAVADVLEGVPSVVVDDYAGGRMLAEYLFERGHRRIIYRSSLRSLESSHRRLLGIQDVADPVGMDIDVVPAVGALTEHEIALVTRGTGRVTAIVGWCDAIAYAAIDNLKRHGLSVPGEVAVCGFDGLPSETKPAQQLTTIRAPWSDVGKKAISTLMHLIDNPDVADVTTLPVDLIIGDTA
jgi:DNA-binding LacI/PurR family transcriptional regulator